MANTLIFLLKNKNVGSFCIATATHIFAAKKKKKKNIKVFENTLATTVNELVNNELLTQTMRRH